MGAPLGNKNGQKGNEWRRALRKAIAHKHGSVSAGLLQIAKGVIDKAEEGDKDSWTEIANRLDGKHATVIAGDQERPVQGVLKIEIVGIQPPG
jgi:hypothetical protein